MKVNMEHKQTKLPKLEYILYNIVGLIGKKIERGIIKSRQIHQKRVKMSEIRIFFGYKLKTYLLQASIYKALVN